VRSACKVDRNSDACNRGIFNGRSAAVTKATKIPHSEMTYRCKDICKHAPVDLL